MNHKLKIWQSFAKLDGYLGSNYAGRENQEVCHMEEREGFI
jgi:hypothetical protein